MTLATKFSHRSLLLTGLVRSFVARMNMRTLTILWLRLPQTFSSEPVKVSNRVHVVCLHEQCILTHLFGQPSCTGQ